MTLKDQAPSNYGSHNMSWGKKCGWMGDGGKII